MAGRTRSRTGLVRGTGVVGALLVSVALVTGCSAGGGGGGGVATKEAEKPPVAKLKTDPAVGAVDVAANAPVQVAVTEGTLDEISLTGADGQPVAGAPAADKKTWNTTGPLAYGVTYTYAGKATGTDGRKVDLKGNFSTVKPAKVVRATVNPIDNATVGVAMPISVKFPEGKVTDRAAVQKALSVTTSVPVEGSWAWLNDRQVDWRPKAYWPAGTKVTLNANLFGVSYGGGVFGKSDVSSRFTIGRNQVVKINTPTHQLAVFQNGVQTATYPASFGLDDEPDRNTPNGTVIVMEKQPVGDFSNPKYGYTNVMKKWAVRISNHGEFIHENQDNAAAIGKKNNSHGCANLLEVDAKAYYDSALVGDPVEITGAAANYPMSPPSDVYDWLIPWSRWQGMSAVR